MYLYDEPKEIKGILVGSGESGNYWEVGKTTLSSCKKTPTKIVAEQVNGEMGYVTWFSIYIDEELIFRINQSFVSEIGYKKEE